MYYMENYTEGCPPRKALFGGITLVYQCDLRRMSTNHALYSKCDANIHILDITKFPKKRVLKKLKISH